MYHVRKSETTPCRNIPVTVASDGGYTTHDTVGVRV